MEFQKHPVKTALGAPKFVETILGRNMFLLAAAGLALASVVLLGGRIRGLLRLRIRAPWLLSVALALQILAISVFPDSDRAMVATMHAASYAVAGLVVFVNRGVRGLPTIGLGGLLNGIAIAANGGTMPASPEALAIAGLTSSSAGFENSAALASPNLSVLGDVFAIPASWPFHNVFSVGDILIACGAAVLLHFACGSRPARSRLAIRVLRWC
jgi:hypothetical protein